MKPSFPSPISIGHGAGAEEPAVLQESLKLRRGIYNATNERLNSGDLAFGYLRSEANSAQRRFTDFAG